MTRTHFYIAGSAFFVALTACTPSGTDAPAGQGDTAAFYRNPAPKDAYRITMTLKDAPGPFAFMKGLAQYDVANRECLRPPKHNPGGHTAPVPTDDVEIPLQKVSDTQYVGTVYADQMLDKDFTGRGVCHWKLMQLMVHMKATGGHAETLFIPSIQHEKLLSESSETVYFIKRSYPREEMEDYPDTGTSNRSDFADSIKDEQLFTVVFVTKKDVGHAN